MYLEKVIFTFLIFLATSSVQAQVKIITCAIAEGYPPFQYVEKGEVNGFDVETIKLFNKYNAGKIEILIKPMPWTDALAALTFTKRVDCVWGMEQSHSRKERFYFTRSLYHRYSSLFVLSGNNINSVDDLNKQIISGDDGAPLHEEFLKEKKFRIIKVNSKEEAFKKLVAKESKAAIMPKRVGEYLAKIHDVKVSILKTSQITSPVGVASNSEAIKNLIQEGLDRIPVNELDFLK